MNDWDLGLYLPEQHYLQSNYSKLPQTIPIWCSNGHFWNLFPRLTTVSTTYCFVGEHSSSCRWRLQDYFKEYVHLNQSLPQCLMHSFSIIQYNNSDTYTWMTMITDEDACVEKDEWYEYVLMIDDGQNHDVTPDMLPALHILKISPQNQYQYIHHPPRHQTNQTLPLYCHHYFINFTIDARSVPTLPGMAVERLNLADLMAERMVNTMMLLLWR